MLGLYLDIVLSDDLVQQLCHLLIRLERAGVEVGLQFHMKRQ